MYKKQTIYDNLTNESLFVANSNRDLFYTREQLNNVAIEKIDGLEIIKGEFWTSKQRQSNSLHEISYRACFKAQLPEFFISKFSKENDVIYDPFSGRGTSVLQAALMNRNIISIDINPLSSILSKSRFFIPTLQEIKEKLNKIPLLNNRDDIDLSMFFHIDTLQEIISMREYFKTHDEYIVNWIRMFATNRLTGHSTGFF
ncbi:MAG: site-specific DNA-methyltransferase [Rickettsiales bacterium]|nr:site-specific DNA-methyltransferase [Rickettsiales bacterium]